MPLTALRFSVPEAARGAFEAALDGLGVALSLDERDGGARWAFELLFDTVPDERDIARRLAAAAGTADILMPSITTEPVADRDWLAVSLSALPPLTVGRFFIHGSHHREPPPAGSLRLLIDAGVAFGTGRHETTRGCLLALDRLRRHCRPARVLDLGCGSGILACAAARSWPAFVVAADHDPLAVRVARENARLNGVAARVRVMVSDGLAARSLRALGPFDLVLANILARPLVKFAPVIARELRRGGRVVLSGLLREHEAWVGGVYRLQGFRMETQIRLGPWSILILVR
jgi:ribosomal protein L11 methyltransferase